MTPFLGTRGRLHTAAASLLVALAAELFKWQDPVTRVSEVLRFPKARRTQDDRKQRSYRFPAVTTPCTD